jgi:hypothetical protein
VSDHDPGDLDDFPLGPGLPEAVRLVLAADDAAAAREQLSNDVVGWPTVIAADGRPQASVISFLRPERVCLR